MDKQAYRTRVMNPQKVNTIAGSVFHLLFLGVDAVLYDNMWDRPIISGNKNSVRIAITDPKKLSAHLDKHVSNITVYIYELQDNGELKRNGDPLKGKPTELNVPNY